MITQTELAELFRQMDLTQAHCPVCRPGIGPFCKDCPAAAPLPLRDEEADEVFNLDPDYIGIACPCCGSRNTIAIAFDWACCEDCTNHFPRYQPIDFSIPGEP
jgi:hypothetical protein